MIPFPCIMREPMSRFPAKLHFLYARSPNSHRLVTTMSHPNFSTGTDHAAATKAVNPLLAPSGGRWRLTATGDGLERSFKFKTFTKTWDFMTAVSLQCKLKNHHPEWSNVYNTTFIRWTTHNPKGLSELDITLATICDAVAKDFGEIESEGDSCSLASIANQAVTAGGDCCTPKKLT